MLDHDYHYYQHIQHFHRNHHHPHPTSFILNMRYWLIKSEPDVYGIHDLARDVTTPWTGIRNYQARNFMRDQMKPGDQAFFYHSNCKEPGIVGVAEVASPAYPDATQFGAKNKYFDATASREEPRWVHVDFRFVRETTAITLNQLRTHPELAQMRILAKGNRLSITPVDPAHWRFIQQLMKA